MVILTEDVNENPTDSGLYYLMSRYYDPTTCRFVNADGYLQSGGALMDTNMNAYCRNNPVVFTDHTGKYPTYTVVTRSGKTYSGVGEWQLGYYDIDKYWQDNITSVSKSISNNTSLGKQVIKGTVSVAYTELNYRLQDNIKTSGSQNGWAGAFAKASAVNGSGKVGFQIQQLSIANKGVFDIATASAQAGLYYNNGVGIGAKAKASVASGRFTKEIVICGWEIEYGVTGDLLSLGAEASAGYFAEEGFKVSASASSGLFGGGILFRIKTPF